jgi:hypothetical protein
MTLIEFNWKPTNRQLRQFGVICVFALPLVGRLWNASWQTAGLLALLGLIIAGVGMVAPSVLKPIFIALTIVATPIGMVIGEVAMLLIYFVLFVPIGLVFRLFRRDALQMKLDKNSETYWNTIEMPTDLASYYRQS